MATYLVSEEEAIVVRAGDGGGRMRLEITLGHADYPGEIRDPFIAREIGEALIRWADEESRRRLESR